MSEQRPPYAADDYAYENGYNYDDDDDDDYDDDDYDDYDEDSYEFQFGGEYSVAYRAGFEAGEYHNSFRARWNRLKWPIEKRIPYKVRNLWFRFMRLFDKDRIPF